MTLHILSQSPSKSSALQDMLNAVSEGDACILIEDGVIAASHPASTTLKETSIPVYILAADLHARGLTESVREGFNIVNDDEFVQLCCKHAKTVSWF